jgi:hypothetical protein
MSNADSPEEIREQARRELKKIQDEKARSDQPRSEDDAR